MAAFMTKIPQDIITTHILTRLPSKSIGRLRRVSKEWLFLLTQPQFIQTHRKTLNTNHFIFESYNDSLYSVPCDNNHEAVSTLTKLHLEKLHNLKIEGSVNGLVLASNLHDKDYTLLVLNLTTKDYVELPISSQKYYFGMMGFGYDSVSDDYKVVTISCFDEFYGNVYVYSLRTNTWKQVTHSPYTHNLGNWSGVFVNGFLHWIVHRHSKPVLVAFSLADEKLSEVPPPCELIDTNLVALGGKLAIFNDVKGDVWLMNEYRVHTSWTKIIHGFNGMPIYNPIVFCDNRKLLFLTSHILLWIYDVEEQTLGESVDISYMKIRRFIGACAESLVSPKFSRSK